MLFGSIVSLFSFWQDGVFIGENIVLKSSGITVLRSTCDFRSNGVSFYEIGCPCLICKYLEL